LTKAIHEPTIVVSHRNPGFYPLDPAASQDVRAREAAHGQLKSPTARGVIEESNKNLGRKVGDLGRFSPIFSSLTGPTPPNRTLPEVRNA
jgi:hypothetical protein